MERKERKERKRKRKMKLTRAESRDLPQRDQPTRLVNSPREPSSRSRAEANVDGSHDQGAILIAAVAQAKKRTPL
jgi:hypothetical protein